MTHADFTVQILLKWIKKRPSLLVTLDLYTQITAAGMKTYLSHKNAKFSSAKSIHAYMNTSRSQQIIFWLTKAIMQVFFNINNLLLKTTTTTRKLKSHSRLTSYCLLSYSLSYLYYKLHCFVLRNYQ